MFKKRKKIKLEISENLKRLKELDQTIDFSKFSLPQPGGKISMPMGGERRGMSDNLYRSKHVAVAHTCCPDGGDFPLHNHEQIECLTVYRGKMTMILEDGPVVMGPGDILRIAPGEPHSAKTEPGTCIVAITVPPSPDWPKG